MESALHALLGTTESSLQINEFTMVAFMDTEIVFNNIHSDSVIYALLY